MFLHAENRYFAEQDNYSKIPGGPVAYWLSNGFVQVFSQFPKLSQFAKPVEGIKTGNNDRFLRYWYEVKRSNEHLTIDDSMDAK